MIIGLLRRRVSESILGLGLTGLLGVLLRLVCRASVEVRSARVTVLRVAWLLRLVS